MNTPNPPSRPDEQQTPRDWPRTTMALALATAASLEACHRDDVKEVVVTDFPEVIVFDIADTSGSTSEYHRDFERPCDENADCLSGFCVEGSDGNICTINCTEDCPTGYQCRGIISGSSDVAFVCVPAVAAPADVVDSDASAPDTTSAADTITATDVTAPTDVGPDTAEPGPDEELCGLPLGTAGEVLLREPPTRDFPDCIVGCGRPGANFTTIVDVRSDNLTAVAGVIDAAEHLYEGNAGPDVDVISIIAPPRTMLEFAIQREDAMSVVDPLIYITDGFAIRTFNRDLSNSNDCARSTIAFPWLQDLPIYVVVEHTLNADVWTPNGYTPGSWVGGPDFRWLMRIRTSPFKPTELGALSARGSTLVARNETVGKPGITRYFRFEAPGTADIGVTLTERGSAPIAFVPLLAGMKTMLGALEWQVMNHDGDDDGRVELQRSAFRPCVPASECFNDDCNGPRCTDDLVEYVIAVADWGGEGGPDFAFDLEVIWR